MERLIEQIKAFINTSDHPVIIGISGHGAAGKTTFSEQLIGELSQQVNVLQADPYILGSNIRKHTTIDYIFDGEAYHSKMTACHPAAHNIDALERDIMMLKNKMDVLTIDTHYAPSERLHGDRNISIIEGMSVAFTNADLYDLLIYFYTDEETEFERRAVRDVNERGMDLEYLKASHLDRRIQYEVFMHPYSEHFDIIVKSTEDKVIVEKMNGSCGSFE